ncbi:MAG: hypothetical protein AB1497_00610 [Bacillota bacterium]
MAKAGLNGAGNFRGFGDTTESPGEWAQPSARVVNLELTYQISGGAKQHYIIDNRYLVSRDPKPYIDYSKSGRLFLLNPKVIQQRVIFIIALEGALY